MTQITTPVAPTAEAPDVEHRRAYRAAGWGGIGAFAAWAAQPVVVALSAASGADEYPDYQAWVADRPFLGGVEVAIFAGVGVGLLFLVLGVARLMRLQAGEASVAAHVGTAMGVVAAASWFLTAGAAAAPFTSVGTGIPEVAPDRDLQVALIDVLNLVLMYSLLAFAVSMIGWAIMLATAGRRVGVVGWPVAIVALVLAAVAIVTFVIPFQPPWGQVGLLLLGVVVGVRLLSKARRA